MHKSEPDTPEEMEASEDGLDSDSTEGEGEEENAPQYDSEDVETDADEQEDAVR